MARRQATVEYLTTTKIGEKGQLTVPKRFRKDLGLGTGAPFAVLRLGDGLVLLPEQQRFEHLCQQVSFALTGAGVHLHAEMSELGGIGAGLDLELLNGIHRREHRGRQIYRVDGVYTVHQVAVAVVASAGRGESRRGKTAGHGADR